MAAEFSPLPMHRSRVTVLGLLRTKGTRCMCDRHSHEQSPAPPLSPGEDVARLALVTASLGGDSPSVPAGSCLRDT